MKDAIIGHTQIVDFFEQTLAHGQISHAYCFIGRNHSGKFTVAEHVAAKLLNTTRERLRLSPDFTVIARARDEKTEKLKKDISVEQIRQAVQFFTQSSFVKDGYKILIIDGAQFMSKAASNALLKTLEEPKGKKIIFLLASDERMMLPTIKSRCQTLFFRNVPESVLSTYAQEQGIGAPEAKEMARFALGLPGNVVNWIKDKEQFNAYKAEVDRFVSLRGKPLYEKLKLVEDLFSEKDDHIAGRDNLNEVLDIWHAHILEASNGQDPHRVVELHEWFVKTKSLLRQNIHPRLLIEHIMIHL